MTGPVPAALPFHVMAKPIGPICNLDCAYCYYLEKEALYPADERFRMPDDVLDAYIRQYIESQPGPDIGFTWQGGEPTLMGLPFFRRVVELQRRHCPAGKRISNGLQTNGTLIDAEWAAFLRDERFLVGISIDGPPELHDAYRTDKGSHPTAERVLRGTQLLLDAGVDLNVLCVVHRRNARRPLDVYRFLTGLGVRHLQFIPLVEPLGSGPVPFEAARRGEGVSERSVLPDDFGRFLIAIFEAWFREDVGRVFVQTFEETLARTVGAPGSLCIFASECGRSLALEHNGDLFSCDHFVRPEHRLGNIRELPMIDLVQRPAQAAFGRAKCETLPAYCRSCEVLDFCHGECPKNRVIRTPTGDPGLNYLCKGYRAYFNAVRPWMEQLARLVRQRLPSDQARRAPAAAEVAR
jgi:uncharacterized protein